MSSTDATGFAAKARQFFERRLTAAADELERRGREAFPRKFDPEAPSYYVRRERVAMERADFELPSTVSPEELGRVLARFWEQRSSPELSGLAEELAGLAADERNDETQSDEVSPFIYVMF